MSMRTAGIHHITAFVRDPQMNVDFYAGVLGLRLVKQTINFDAPEVYHLYFGNEGGSPGTIMTFFPAPGSRLGQVGGGQVGFTTFVVPQDALLFWEERLTKLKVEYQKTERFGETYLQFTDYDGLQLEIVAREQGPNSQWEFGGIPADQAVKGFGGAVLFSTKPDETMQTLENVLGLQRVSEEQGLVRYQAKGDLGNLIDINVSPMNWGGGGAGTIHHIAWRAEDDKQQLELREHVLQHGFQPTDVVDRQYFNAVYFRETGGILFEIATDPPGFANDEPAETMGQKLMLPSWYEPHRQRIEANLLPFEVRVLEGDQE